MFAVYGFNDSDRVFGDLFIQQGPKIVTAAEQNRIEDNVKECYTL